MQELEAGSIIGSYRVVRAIGQGGMGAVYEVEHVKPGVRYAMKTFTLEEGDVDLFRKRFSAEGKILARLSHPNLVRVIDLDIDENVGALYFVMELVLYEDGETHTLDDIEPGGADEEQIFEWFQQMCNPWRGLVGTCSAVIRPSTTGQPSAKSMMFLSSAAFKNAQASTLTFQPRLSGSMPVALVLQAITTMAAILKMTLSNWDATRTINLTGKVDIHSIR